MTSDLTIKREADRCVMCGLCLPHCPTYLKTRNESESPRGRIALMRALASDELPLTQPLQSHLDNCLLCRACEAKCPSKVNYAAMMDATRIAIREAHHNAHLATPSPLERLATERPYRHKLGTLLWLADKSGLRALGRGLKLTKAVGLARMEQLTPTNLKRPRQWHHYYPATIDKRADVALFTGCFSDLFDQQTLGASITLLNRLGYGVHIPATQNCCGALHYHQGDAEKAAKLMQQNRAAFADLEIEAIISSASGCASHLQEHGPVTREISEFLAAAPWPDDIHFTPLPLRVAVHEPCSLRNVLKATQPPYQLLEKIPRLEIVPLPDNAQCCGAAGRYMIDQPAMADRLRADKLSAMTTTNAEILVTTNIGCALHLAAGLRKDGSKVDTLHPVTLLARQLKVSAD